MTIETYFNTTTVTTDIDSYLKTWLAGRRTWNEEDPVPTQLVVRMDAHRQSLADTYGVQIKALTTQYKQALDKLYEGDKTTVETETDANTNSVTEQVALPSDPKTALTIVNRTDTQGRSKGDSSGTGKSVTSIEKDNMETVVVLLGRQVNNIIEEVANKFSSRWLRQVA